jgi:antitoxin component of RelBE/YafQ-DinJ toxin-antitoxin module
MTTQVVFRVDPKLKTKASKKAANEGMNLSTVLKLATQAFVDGEFQVGLKFNSKTRGEINKILKDVAKNKNLSPSFKSTKAMIAALKK